MLQSESDELKMLETVQALFITNIVKITPVADLLTGKNQLDAYITTLKANRDMQNVNNTGIAENKRQTKATMIQDTLDLAGPLVNLGQKTSNNQLIQEFNFSKTDLEKMRDNDLLSNAQNTATAANTNIAALAPGGVTAAMVTKLNTDITNWTAILTAPTTAIDQKKVATQKIKDTFPFTRKLTDNTLTPLMRTNFRIVDPTFFNQYLQSIQIIDTGIHHLSIFGSIVNSVNSNHVNGAVIVIFENGNEIETVKSGDQGNYRIKNLSEGTYTVVISRPGYVTKTFPGIVVIAGNSTKTDFVITPV